jgi:hypothetical protein
MFRAFRQAVNWSRDCIPLTNVTLTRRQQWQEINQALVLAIEVLESPLMIKELLMSLPKKVDKTAVNCGENSRLPHRSRRRTRGPEGPRIRIQRRKAAKMKLPAVSGRKGMTTRSRHESTKKPFG